MTRKRKAKAPPAAPLGPRSTSGTVPVATVMTKPRASGASPNAVAARSVTVGSAPASNANRAVEELTKWANLTLGKGLNSNINGMHDLRYPHDRKTQKAN